MDILFEQSILTDQEAALLNTRPVMARTINDDHGRRFLASILQPIPNDPIGYRRDLIIAVHDNGFKIMSSDGHPKGISKPIPSYHPFQDAALDLMGFLQLIRLYSNIQSQGHKPIILNPDFREEPLHSLLERLTSPTEELLETYKTFPSGNADSIILLNLLPDNFWTPGENIRIDIPYISGQSVQAISSTGNGTTFANKDTALVILKLHGLADYRLHSVDDSFYSQEGLAQTGGQPTSGQTISLHGIYGEDPILKYVPNAPRKIKPPPQELIPRGDISAWLVEKYGPGYAGTHGAT